jgi:penicillin-binding protein 1C
VKTGTSKDLRDNWCIGFTSRYTVGVWVGNAGGAPMHGVSGVAGAAPVWRDVVAQLHALSPAKAPAPPPGLAWQGSEPFIAGTAPARGSAAALQRAGRFGIASPRDGSVIALDPDIPPAQQRLVFEGARGTWLLDGRRIGEGPAVAWLPSPGRHRLELHSGGSVDRVEFEVRPAPWLQPGPRGAQDAGAKMRSTAASMTMPHRL